MAHHTTRRTTGATAALIALGLTAGVALAQDNTAGGAQHDAASKGSVIGAGAGSGGGSPNTIVDPSNGGVAGTGMGKMTANPKGSAAGMGNSVKGPAGQGISNSTDTAQ